MINEDAQPPSPAPPAPEPGADPPESGRLALLGFALLAGIRAVKVDRMVSAYTGCDRCIIGGLVHHDLALLALLAALLGLDLLVHWRWLRAFCACVRLRWSWFMRWIWPCSPP